MALQQVTEQQQIEQTREERPAGFWIRIAGNLLDSLIIGIPLGIIFTIIIGSVGLEMMQSTMVTEAQLMELQLKLGLVYTIMSGISMLYSLLLPTLWNGYTVGKRIVGVHITKVNGGKVTIGTMLLRNIVGGLVEAIALGGFVSLIMVLAREDKRTLHDLVAGTQVKYVN